MHTYLSDERLRKEEKLLKRAEFNAVFERGQSVGSKYLVVHWIENDLGHPRLGLVVGVRFGNAVKRNAWKRHIREIFRRNKAAFGNRDVVVLPGKRDEAKTAGHDELTVALLSVLKRMEG
jgi:ribonuclease P protein component